MLGFYVSITMWFVFLLLIVFSVYQAFSTDDDSKSLKWLLAMFGFGALLIVDVIFIWYFSI